MFVLFIVVVGEVVCRRRSAVSLVVVCVPARGAAGYVCVAGTRCRWGRSVVWLFGLEVGQYSRV